MTSALFQYLSKLLIDEEHIINCYLGPLFVHLAGAIFMMTCSWYYHNYQCQCSERMKYLRKFDLSGICMMICCSATPAIYYSYMCEESWFYGKLFLGQIYVCCFGALYVTMCQGVSKNEKYRKIIAAIAYLVAGYSCAPALIYATFKLRPEVVHSFSLWPWSVGGILYAIGAILYALKFPERYFPGIFDIWGNSHQLFHLYVLAAAFLHFYGSLRCIHERQLYPCPESGQF